LPEERSLNTRDQIFDEITAALGGRAAEEVIINEISTGALNDLEKVTKQAYASVAYFGLSEKIGNISYFDSSGQQDFYFTKPYSEKTSEIIDAEVKYIVDQAYQRAKEIIINNLDKVTQLAELLLEKEVIFREDVENIFGPRQWEDSHTDKKTENKTENADTNDKTEEEEVKTDNNQPE
jgi:cell division protease FtsH